MLLYNKTLYTTVPLLYVNTFILIVLPTAQIWWHKVDTQNILTSTNLIKYC